MKHWIWDGYSPGAGYAFAEGQQGLSDEASEDVFRGRKVGEPLPETRVTELSPGKLPGAMASAFDAILVSDALGEVLRERVKGDVQLLPARVKGERYWVVNPLRRVPAMDLEKSEYETDEDRKDVMDRVRRLVLRPIPEDAPALFRMEEIPYRFLVSDELRRAMEGASDAAGDFEDPADFRLGVFLDDDE